MGRRGREVERVIDGPMGKEWRIRRKEVLRIEWAGSGGRGSGSRPHLRSRFHPVGRGLVSEGPGAPQTWKIKKNNKRHDETAPPSD
eukprot:8627702-Pyramimonas_sp.AAC.3